MKNRGCWLVWGRYHRGRFRVTSAGGCWRGTGLGGHGRSLRFGRIFGRGQTLSTDEDYRILEKYIKIINK